MASAKLNFFSSFLNGIICLPAFLLLSFSHPYQPNFNDNNEGSPDKKQIASFIKNNGQLINTSGKAQNDVLYFTRLKGMDVYFFKNKVSYVLKKLNGEDSVLKLHRIDMLFSNSDLNSSIQAEGPTHSANHYFSPACLEGLLNVNSYSKIIYRNLYPHIDLVFYAGNSSGLKYDFVVNTGANITDIQIAYEGADLVEQAENNQLKITTGLGTLSEELPLVYQLTNNNKKEISASYVLCNNTVSFNVALYDPSKSLFIDPWATFLGGVDIEEGKGITLGNNGNVYVTGITSGIDYPVSTGAFQISSAGSYDAFVAKYDSSGNRLWSTYYGGSGSDFANKLQADNNGNIIFCGHTTSTDFPVSSGAWQTASAGSYDAFLVKLDSTGNRIWATYVGGSGGELGIDVAIDSGNNILFGGQSSSLDFPVTTGAFQTIQAGAIDAFVCKFNSGGNLVWATYFGGNNGEDAHCITVDSSNSVIIAGGSNSTNLSTTPGALQSSLTGSFDVYILKLDSNGTRLWSTYFGGSNYDDVFGVSTDAANNLYFGGNTNSTDFPVTLGAYQSSNNGSNDACIFKLGPSGNLIWSTYFGGTLSESVEGLKTDTFGNNYLLLYTNSTNMPIVGTPVQALNAGGNDLFLAKFNSFGIPAWSTYYGGTVDDIGMDLEVDNYMNVFITGHTYSSDFPMMGNSYQPLHAGDIDAFILNINGSQDITVSNDSPYFLNNGKLDFHLFPNPAEKTTNLYYTLIKNSNVLIELIDIRGMSVMPLTKEFQTKGEKRLSVNFESIKPGVYLLWMQTEDEIITKKIIRK